MDSARVSSIEYHLPYTHLPSSKGTSNVNLLTVRGTHEMDLFNVGAVLLRMDWKTALVKAEKESIVSAEFRRCLQVG